MPTQPHRACAAVTFKDHFSARSALYAAHRPTYPDSLFDVLAVMPSRKLVACDCATGNGQAALGLAGHFRRVVAVDASQSQLEHATRNPGVSYVAAAAEDIPLRAGSVDLVAVAQALHWLHLAEFYDEVRRILAPGGALAIWGYGDPVLDDPDLQAVVHHFNRVTIESYWSPERMILLDGYSTIPFPFREARLPALTLTREWTLAEMTGYLRTWSASAAYSAAHGVDPVTVVEAELAEIWGPPEARRMVRWPLCLRAGHA